MNWVLVAAFSIVLLCLKAEGKGGFIFTSPGKLQLGVNESLCLQLTDFNEDVFASFRIVDNATTIAKSEHTFINGKSDCVQFPLPKLPDHDSHWKKFDLEVIGVGQTSGYRFSGETKVELVQTKPGIVFIQTDKPLYKPGQLVRVRILIVDETLRPIKKPVSVVIRNPLSVRLAYWPDQQSTYGLFDLEFQLSKEPVMGTWVIEATFEGTKYPTSFKVEEYVLPKYEVTVTPPTYLNPWTPEIQGKVCAKYTYGKPVVGDLRVEVCLNKGGYYSSSNANQACTEFKDFISGCQDFKVNATLLGLAFNTYSVWSAKVTYNATVENVATGIALHGYAETTSIKKEEVNLKFEDVSEYYKPGLPFTGKVVATRPDSTAAPGEPVRLTARNYNTGLHFEGNFTTDSTGSFFFSLPPEASEEIFNLQASALRYEQGSYSMPENHHVVSDSRAYFYVKPWYSRSKSYLEISTIQDTVMCEGKIPVEITYTTPVATNYMFYYQILSGGNIVSMDSVQNAFEGSEYKSKEHETESLVRITTLAPPPIPTTPTSNETVNGTTVAPEKDPEAPIPFNNNENDILPEKDLKRQERETGDAGVVVSDRLARFQFTIPLTTSMRSGGKLIVYYIREDGEVVADNTEFKAENCVDNKVEMTFTENPVAPGDAATLQVKAAPGSLCGIGVVDKSILLLGGNNQLSLEHVIKTLKELDPMRYFYGYLDYQERNKYCLDQVGIPEKFQDEVNETMLRLSYDWWDMPYRYELDQTDSYEAFIKMGFVVATNLDILTRPCQIVDKRRRNKLGRTFTDSEEAPRAVALSGGQASPRAGVASVNSVQSEVISAGEEPKARTYFPETWLWDLEKVGDDGILEVKKEIPDTITEWVGSSVCTSSELGLGVSKTATVTVFQPFFASYTLPYSVVRGERIPIPVTVFNYLEDCLAVQLSLDTSGGGFDLDGEPKATICVCGQDAETHRYFITPNTIGEVNITVDARSVTDDGYCSNSLKVSTEGIGVRDIITRPLLVESEGIPEEYTRSYFVCPGENEDNRYEKKIPMNLPEKVILDSARGYVNIIGDLMGSALTNLDSLVKMPYGCGEQNMASFTPNIFVLQYLQSTKRLTPEIEQKALNYMRIGYQRELRYRHPDGSYSSFGPGNYYDGSRSSGSSWLTAFVVKSLAQARPYIYIDQEDLDKSINFFKSTQNNETGCFPKIGQSSAYLKGGNEGQANSTLTAYILAALLEANTSVKDPAVKEAVRCIDEDDFSDLYTTALAAYALTLYDEGLPLRHKLLETLRNAVIEEEGQQHWERKDKPKEKTLRPWWWWAPASSAEVEMTSYALMALITKQKAAVLIGQPIVQWLSRQRNAYGGFSSTQDTVVALQALADYGAIAYSDGLDMTITVTDDDDKDLMTFLLTKDYSLIPRKQLIESLPTDVTVSATGVGCALVQANVRYNVEGETPKDPAFDVEVKLFQSIVEPKNCDRQRMQVCARFTVPSQASNMAIIEVKMVTGWVPEESSLKDLTKPQNSAVQRYEIDNNIINLYFDEITATKSCVYFEIIKELTVNNTQPGRVHVYDYYESDYSVFNTYEIDPQCNNNFWTFIWYDDIARVPGAPPVPALSENNTVAERQALGKESLTMPAQYYEPCPVCLDEVPDNVESLFCNSSFAYKVQAGRNGSYTLKIQAKFRPNKDKFALDKTFSNYELPKGCKCPILREYVKVFVFGPPQIHDPEAEIVTFDGRSTVVRLVNALEKRLRNTNCPK